MTGPAYEEYMPLVLGALDEGQIALAAGLQLASSSRCATSRGRQL